jgi:hypothetical protein
MAMRWVIYHTPLAIVKKNAGSAGHPGGAGTSRSYRCERDLVEDFFCESVFWLDALFFESPLFFVALPFDFEPEFFFVTLPCDFEPEFFFVTLRCDLDPALLFVTPPFDFEPALCFVTLPFDLERVPFFVTLSLRGSDFPPFRAPGRSDVELFLEPEVLRAASRPDFFAVIPLSWEVAFLPVAGPTCCLRRTGPSDGPICDRGWRELPNSRSITCPLSPRSLFPRSAESPARGDPFAPAPRGCGSAPAVAAFIPRSPPRGADAAVPDLR